LTCSSFLLYALWLDESQSRLIFINFLVYVPFFVLMALSLLVRKGTLLETNQQGSAEQA
jgi:hypothetical protein